MLYVSDVDQNPRKITGEDDVVMSAKNYLLLKSGCNEAKVLKEQVEELKKRLEALSLIVEQPDEDVRIGLTKALFSAYGDDLCEVLKPYLYTTTTVLKRDEKTSDVVIINQRGKIPQDVLDMYKTKGGEKPTVTNDLSNTFFSLNDLEHEIKKYLEKFN